MYVNVYIYPEYLGQVHHINWSDDYINYIAVEDIKSKNLLENAIKLLVQKLRDDCGLSEILIWRLLFNNLCY